MCCLAAINVHSLSPIPPDMNIRLQDATDHVAGVHDKGGIGKADEINIAPEQGKHIAPSTSG
jgi:hypothetical protein